MRFHETPQIPKLEKLLVGLGGGSHGRAQSSRRSLGSTPSASDNLRIVEGWKPSLRGFFSKRTIVLGLICAFWASSRCEKPCPIRSRLSLLPSRYVINSIISDCPPILLSS